MITLARAEMGLTQEDAAQQMGISQALLSRIESGLVPVTPEVEAALCRLYRRPPAFFKYEGPIECPTFVQFRQKGVSPDLMNRCLARMTLKSVELSRLLAATEISEQAIPPIDPGECDGGAREVAQRIRRVWRLPRGPVKELLTHIENSGCVIITMDFGTRRISGCSGWIGNTPVIFLNEGMTAVRLRFTAAHEFGHLVMHRYPSEQTEREAYVFACELLMPSEEIIPMLKPLSLDKLARLKLYWHVSMQAIVWNAELLGVMQPSTKRRWIGLIGARDWMDNEPYDEELKPEIPTLLKEIIDTHRNELRYTDTELAKLLLRCPDQLGNDGQGMDRRLRRVK